MKSYNNRNDVGYKFSLERFEGKSLQSKLVADYIKWDREKKQSYNSLVCIIFNGDDYGDYSYFIS